MQSRGGQFRWQCQAQFRRRIESHQAARSRSATTCTRPWRRGCCVCFQPRGEEESAESASTVMRGRQRGEEDRGQMLISHRWREGKCSHRCSSRIGSLFCRIRRHTARRTCSQAGCRRGFEFWWRSQARSRSATTHSNRREVAFFAFIGWEERRAQALSGKAGRGRHTLHPSLGIEKSIEVGGRN